MHTIFAIVVCFMIYRIWLRQISVDFMMTKMDVYITRMVKTFKTLLLVLAAIIVAGYFFAIKWGGIIIFSKMAMVTISTMAIIVLAVAVLTGLAITIRMTQRRV